MDDAGFRIWSSGDPDRAGDSDGIEKNEPKAQSSSMARGLYQLRRRRERFFASHLFAEPSWDLLLDLLAAEERGSRVSITSALIAASAPTTTALRCLKELEAQGMVFRERDPSDGRRIYVRLSSEAISSLEALFDDFHRCFR
jgi:DNA-binding MarR family transcriptional regulator